MKISVLAENTSGDPALCYEHGLSLLIETQKHRLLFDTGASALFAENAAKMGIDLTGVDMAVLSHGHYDHGGGIRTFLGLNSRAKFYIHRRAFEPHYANHAGEKAPIGLDPALMPNDRFVLTGDRFAIDEQLELFAGVNGKRLLPSGNSDLFSQVGGEYILDDFAHEQNLIVRENGKTLLVAGCAHRGIANILEAFALIEGRMPDIVIGGFHLYNRAADTTEDAGLIAALGAFLKSTGALFYTCHCTGLEAYARLKETLGEQVRYFAGGDRLTIESINKKKDG